VLSSTEEGEVSYQPVTRVFQRSGAEEVALTFTDAHGVGAPVVTTPEHPFRVASGEWVAAGRLDIGDNVVTAEGGLATLSAALSLEKSGTVHNFEVEGTHSYFVGGAKLWVHNACLKGTNKKGQVTDRSSFRKGTVQKAWDNAESGPNGGRLCTTCGKEVNGAPGQGPRDWDVNHDPAWTNRSFEPGVTRPEVRDNYQDGTWLECPSCNRGAGNRPR
jgi:hypothetical protein